MNFKLGRGECSGDGLGIVSTQMESHHENHSDTVCREEDKRVGVMSLGYTIIRGQKELKPMCENGKDPRSGMKMEVCSAMKNKEKERISKSMTSSHNSHRGASWEEG